MRMTLRDHRPSRTARLVGGAYNYRGRREKRRGARAMEVAGGRLGVSRRPRPRTRRPGDAKAPPTFGSRRRFAADAPKNRPWNAVINLEFKEDNDASTQRRRDNGTRPTVAGTGSPCGHARSSCLRCAGGRSCVFDMAEPWRLMAHSYPGGRRADTIFRHRGRRSSRLGQLRHFMFAKCRWS